MAKAREWVYGHHAVSAVLRTHPERVLVLWLAEGVRGMRWDALVADARSAGVAVEVVSKKKLDARVEGNHQGVVAQCVALPDAGEAELEVLLAARCAPLLLVLDGVTDPHNLGACLRTADAVGVDAVIVPRAKSAGLSPTVRKVASGAAEHLPLFRVINLARTLDALKARGVWLVGTAGEADRALYDVRLTGALALVLGAEGKGMRRLTRERCDFLVRIPMLGRVSSLNVSVAAGVCLYEALRQRDAEAR